MSIAKVAPGGMGEFKRRYNVVDAFPTARDVFYRLKIVDRDGQYVYSKVVKISPYLVAASVTVFPNPATDYVTIVSQERFSAVQLLNASGSLLRWGKLPVNGRYDVAALRPGIYFLRLVSSHGVNVQRFVKK